MTLTVTWAWRSSQPARSPPDPRFPYGIAVDLSQDAAKSCEAVLPYPAEGLGIWLVRCDTCGYAAAITAAGRADDPTKVRVPCK